MTMNIKLQNAIIESCPWWKNKSCFSEIKQRDIYSEIEKTLTLKQMICISGLRRVGKTSLMFYIINELLKNTDPGDILFFSFDNFADTDISAIIDEYKLIQKKTALNIFSSMKYKRLIIGRKS